MTMISGHFGFQQDSNLIWGPGPVRACFWPVSQNAFTSATIPFSMVWDVLLCSLLPQESGAELILSYVDLQCTYGSHLLFALCIFYAGDAIDYSRPLFPLRAVPGGLSQG